MEKGFVDELCCHTKDPYLTKSESYQTKTDETSETCSLSSSGSPFSCSNRSSTSSLTSPEEGLGIIGHKCEEIQYRQVTDNSCYQIHLRTMNPQCAIKIRHPSRAKKSAKVIFDCHHPSPNECHADQLPYYLESYGQVKLRRKEQNKSHVARRKLPSNNRLVVYLCLICVLSILFSHVLSSPYSGGMFTSFTPADLNLIEGKQRVLMEILAPRVSEEMYTIRITSRMGRVDLIQNSIDSHSLCSRVKEVQVDWQGVSAEPPLSVLEHSSGKVVISNSSGASSTFPQVLTNAILLLDDDLVFTCDEIDRAFSVWKHNPDRMVGFFPYSHKKEQAKGILPFSRPSSRRRYRLADVEEFKPGYSLMSDRASFIHRMYLGSVPSVQPLQSPCRDVSLSLIVTSISSKSPIAVAASPLELIASAALKKIQKVNHSKKLMTSTKCLTSSMEKLDLKELPDEERIFVGETYL